MAQTQQPETSIPQSTALFGGLGVIPFVAGAVLANIPSTSASGHWLVIGYGAVILSFLGGIQWGVGLKSVPRAWLPYLIAISISLMGWIALLLTPLWGLLLLGAGYIAAFFYDAVTTPLFDLPGWFIRLRILLTMSVLASLGVAALPLIP